jgi:hypothetical protein
MNEQELFSYSIYEEQTQLEERELSSFITAVTEMLGPELARSATEVWLEEADLMDDPPRSIDRDWRSVTIAASARLLTEFDALQHRKMHFFVAPIDTRVSPQPLSDRLVSSGVMRT